MRDSILRSLSFVHIYKPLMTSAVNSEVVAEPREKNGCIKPMCMCVSDDMIFLTAHIGRADFSIVDDIQGSSRDGVGHRVESEWKLLGSWEFN